MIAVRVLFKVSLCTLTSFQHRFIYVVDAPGKLDKLELAIGGVLDYLVVMVPLDEANRDSKTFLMSERRLRIKIFELGPLLHYIVLHSDERLKF